ncbi:hypothetical protein IFM89_004557 [Coptis chinensis]|uniref:Uncharacterized protein n=1 Tax=Coptis chinensis TaxID=261450 RepID=A0A835LDI0_9MAGN|nr:hypothetical protein IFM89_004557 [Coptis chinensis]
MLGDDQEISPPNGRIADKVPIPVNCNTLKPDPFNMGPLIDQIKVEAVQSDASMEEVPPQDSPEIFSSAVTCEGCSGYAGFLDPDEVSVPSVSSSLVSSYRGQRIQLLHKDVLLQLHCYKAESALWMDSGSSSIWRPVVIRKNDFLNSSTVRIHLPTLPNWSCGEDSSVYATEMYQRDTSGTSRRLVFNKFDATQLDSLLFPGALIDTFVSLDVYDYQQSAGIRLVAKKLIIHS